VTSLVDLGRPIGLDDVDAALRAAFEAVFECETRPVDAPALAGMGTAQA